MVFLSRHPSGRTHESMKNRYLLLAKCLLLGCGVGSQAEVRHERAACERELLLVTAAYPECLKTVGQTRPNGTVRTVADCDELLTAVLLMLESCPRKYPDGQKVWLPDHVRVTPVP